MITIKTTKEIGLMREGGRITSRIMKELRRLLRPGVSALEVDRLAEKLTRQNGAAPSFKGFEGYQYSTCINVNQGVVHGIPTKSLVFRKGDVVKVDFGVLYKGLNCDTAWSYLIENEDSFKKQFLKQGELTLFAAINKCLAGNRIGDVSSAIQKGIERSGFSVVSDLVGHGVGRDLHEDPQIPGLGRPGTGPIIAEGMTLAIEVIYTAGSGQITLENDSWTLSAADDRMAGLFEHTVAVSKRGVEILTL